MTKSGKSNPLNAAPHPKGNVLVTELVAAVTREPTGKYQGRTLSGVPLEEARAAGTPLHLSHFADCAQAGAWRKA